MSATDSESSIDWLATDNEDEENEREPDCTGRSGQTQRPLTPSLRPHKSAELKTVGSVWSKVGDGDGRESPSSCTDAWHRDASRLYQTPHGWGAKCTQNGVKRPHGSTVAEHQERMLISNPLEKAQVFTGKCMELQCYIHPLSSILSGLRSGRYRERLSSFQESVAIDRIQRIMGVLQNPSMGEKYVTIILKVEEMLKSWFPNVKHQDQVTVAQTEKEAPAKRIKLSPVTTDLTSVPSLTSPVVTAAPMAQGTKALRVTDLTPSGAYSASNLEWLHTSPVCSPSAGQPQAPASARHLLPPRDKALTQDSAVSSSTDRNAKTDSAPNGPPPGKINAPCLERLLKSTESLIACKGTGGVMGNS